MDANMEQKGKPVTEPGIHCTKWIDGQGMFMDESCGKLVVAEINPGVYRCQKHYNKWLKKINKSDKQ